MCVTCKIWMVTHPSSYWLQGRGGNVEPRWQLLKHVCMCHLWQLPWLVSKQVSSLDNKFESTWVASTEIVEEYVFSMIIYNALSLNLLSGAQNKLRICAQFILVTEFRSLGSLAARFWVFLFLGQLWLWFLVEDIRPCIFSPFLLFTWSKWWKTVQ